MRICIVYDCLYPHTVGGAERWYRNVAERLAAAGHDVTYLTLRQWRRGADPGVSGVNVVSAGPPMALYVEGRRRILPPLVFGAGVLWHMLRHGRRYDVVHTASFPYFSVLAIAAAYRRIVVVDWHEVWSDAYWREYLGAVGGRIGAVVQRLCARIGDFAFCFSQLHAKRLRDEGFRGPIEVLTGEYAGSVTHAESRPAEPVVVFAGRHIPEKRVPELPAAIAEARRRLPSLRAQIYGDGPDRDELLERIRSGGLAGVVDAPGFVDGDTVDAALSRALCMVLPSRREGYGLVVVEASSRGTPSVVVADPDNAATELVRVHDAGPGLRASTADWFNENAARLSIETSLARVTARYERGL